MQRIYRKDNGVAHELANQLGVSGIILFFAFILQFLRNLYGIFVIDKFGFSSLI